MFYFEYIAHFWYQQEAQEPGFIIGRTCRRENLCIQRGLCVQARGGRECAVFDHIYAEVSRAPYLLSAFNRSYYNAILRNINTKKH